VSLGSELARLEPAVREMVVLRHLDGLTQEEIAARTGYSRKWVGVKLQAAESQLQAALAPARADGEAT
jgi:RNA polymerase sigma factor (sigma-70 family)